MTNHFNPIVIIVEHRLEKSVIAQKSRFMQFTIV
jgi:hypothetical protein